MPPTDLDLGGEGGATHTSKNPLSSPLELRYEQPRSDAEKGTSNHSNRGGNGGPEADCPGTPPSFGFGTTYSDGNDHKARSRTHPHSQPAWYGQQDEEAGVGVGVGVGGMSDNARHGHEESENQRLLLSDPLQSLDMPAANSLASLASFRVGAFETASEASGSWDGSRGGAGGAVLHKGPQKFGLEAHEVAAHARIPFILSGYRSPGTLSETLRSLFRLHNELANTWTMIVLFVEGLAMFCVAMLYILPKYGGPHDPTAFIFHFFTSSVLLPGSFGNHMFICRSADIHAWWRRLDVLMIRVSCFTYCMALGWEAYYYSRWALFINTIVTTSYVSVALYRTWLHDFENKGLERDSHTVETGIGVALYLIPAMVVVGRDLSRGVAGAAVVGGLGLFFCLFISAFLFAFHFPERFFPRKFDYFSGHAIFHCMLILAHGFSYTFIVAMYIRRHTENVVP